MSDHNKSTFSGDNNSFPSPKLAPNSSSNVKVIGITFYPRVDGISFASSVGNIDCTRTNCSGKVASFMVVRIHWKRGWTFGNQFAINLDVVFSSDFGMKGYMEKDGNKVEPQSIPSATSPGQRGKFSETGQIPAPGKIFWSNSSSRANLIAQFPGDRANFPTFITFQL